MGGIERFRWVEQSGLGEIGACVSFVETTDWQMVAAAFGGVVAKARAAGVNTFFGEVDEEDDEEGWDDVDEKIPVLMLFQQADWTIVLEICGWQGSTSQVLQRLAPGRSARTGVATRTRASPTPSTTRSRPRSR